MEPNKIEQFNNLFSNEQSNMCKVLLPYLPSSMQSFAIMIKYLELQYTMDCIYSKKLQHNENTDVHTYWASDSPFHIQTVCRELLPHCNEQKQLQIKQICNLFTTFENMQGMMEMMETLKTLFPDSSEYSEGDNDNFSTDPMQLLSGLLGGKDLDLSMLMNLFSNMNCTLDEDE